MQASSNPSDSLRMEANAMAVVRARRDKPSVADAFVREAEIGRIQLRARIPFVELLLEVDVDEPAVALAIAEKDDVYQLTLIEVLILPSQILAAPSEGRPGRTE